jgi:hypothetical protein
MHSKAIALFRRESATRVKAELHANRVRNWRYLPSDELLYAN